MLTRKPAELLRFIHERLREAGVPPSCDEMKDALDLRSKSGIHRLITALEERGFIRRLPNRARAIEVIKLPELASAGGNGRRGLPPAPWPCRSWAASPPARRSKRFRRAATPSAYRRTCWDRASITPSRCAGIRWLKRESSTATWR